MVVPTISRLRVPIRSAIRGAMLDSGIITAAIGSRPADGPQGAVAEHRLQELHEHEEHAEHHGEDDEQGDRTGGEGPVAEQPHVEQRMRVAQLPRHERASAAMPATMPDRVSGSVQPCSGPSWMASTMPPMAIAESTPPSDVEAVLVHLAGVLDVRDREREGDARTRAIGSTNNHRQVNQSTMAAEKNRPRMPPAPAKPAQMPIALARSFLGERRGDHRQRDGHDHRRAGTGDEPGEQHHRGRGRRARRPTLAPANSAEADEQHALAAPAVADGADRQQQGGERHRVAVDDPQQRVLRGAEVDGELLLGDVEARHRGDDGDERGAHRDQDQAESPGVVDHDRVERGIAERVGEVIAGVGDRSADGGTSAGPFEEETVQDCTVLFHVARTRGSRETAVTHGTAHRVSRRYGLRPDGHDRSSGGAHACDGARHRRGHRRGTGADGAHRRCRRRPVRCRTVDDLPALAHP